MENYTTFVGLDAHKKNIFVAMKVANRKEYIEFEIPHTEEGIKKMCKKIQQESIGEIVSCYEAGPCGFALQRKLNKKGIKCKVIAPSLIPIKPGEKIKTDRRDARKLADMLKSEMLTEVHPPTEEEEAVRDLCRCREKAVIDLLRCRHRIGKMLLRRGIIYSGKSHWTLMHKKWLKEIKLAKTAAQIALEDYIAAMEQVELRLKSLEEEISKIASKEPYKEHVGYLRCFRGIDTITAMGILSELYDFRRFRTARALMAFLGLVPSERSSSDKVTRGSITKTGNQIVRRLLIETSWHYRRKPAAGKILNSRRKGQPSEVIQIADKAQHRLYKRYCHLAIGKGKPQSKVITVLARELAGFIWSVLYAGSEKTIRPSF
jgi:transposase